MSRFNTIAFTPKVPIAKELLEEAIKTVETKKQFDSSL